MLILHLTACDPIGSLANQSLGPDPTSHFQVHLFEKNGEQWTRDVPAIAHAFSSLHAVVWADELVVCGLGSARPPSFVEERFPRLAVAALVTRDLKTWTARSFSVDAPGVSLIDPAIVAGPEGEELWFVQADGAGDPGQQGRAVQIVRTKWDGNRFGNATIWAVGSGLVDPAPIWFGGAWHVFATRDHAAVVSVEEGGRTQEVLGSATVPFAREQNGELVLFGQRMGAEGMLPVVTRTGDGVIWSTVERALPLSATSGTGPPPPLRTCTSAVTATFLDKDVLLCVEEVP